MKNITYHLIVLLFIPAISISSELKPFSSDGCSSFPNGTIRQQSLWLKCCTRHDIEYWKGGTYEDRLKADRALEQCVAELGEPAVAKLMLAGVRVGGSPYFPTPYRWGYGWPYPRGYKALNEEELLQVKQKIKLLNKVLQK